MVQPLRDGQLPAEAVRIPLTGDLVYSDGFNANGITPTPDGRGLLIVQSNTGGLFRVDWSGETRRVNLHGESLREGDGLLLHGRTLFAVQNRLNAVAVLRHLPNARFDTSPNPPPRTPPSRSPSLTRTEHLSGRPTPHQQEPRHHQSVPWNDAEDRRRAQPRPVGEAQGDVMGRI